MPTFHYLAVQNADNRKMMGQIDADTESAARAELNKMGLAILSLDTKVPSKKKPNDNLRTFEFEATDSGNKSVDGTIEAYDREAAYDRLTTEFHFKVTYICLESSSAAEKKKAHIDGVESIIEIKQARENAAEVAYKKTFKGGLEELVKKAEDAFKNTDEAGTTPATPVAQTTESATETADEQQDQQIEKESVKHKESDKNPNTAPERAKLSHPEDEDTFVNRFADKFKKSPLQHSWTEWQFSKSGLQKYWQKLGFASLVKNIKSKFSTDADDELEFSVDLVEPKKTDSPVQPQSATASEIKFNTATAKLSTLLKAVIFPPAGQTHAQAYAIFKNACLTRQQKVQTTRKLNGMLRELHRGAAIEKFWQTAAYFISTLAFLYFTYFLLASFALQYEWGKFSYLATVTVGHSTFIPYITFTLIFIRLLISIRSHFTAHRAVATSLLFTSGAVLLFVAGVNVLYT